MSYSAEFNNLPNSIKDLVLEGIKLAKPKSIILFGSRARGDFKENSDYDIAFTEIENKSGWVKFLVKQDEEPISLLKVDLLNFEETSDNYKKNIIEDGKSLYES